MYYMRYYLINTSLLLVSATARCSHTSRLNYNNNNNHDDIYSAVIMTRSLREFTRFIW